MTTAGAARSHTTEGVERDTRVEREVEEEAGMAQRFITGADEAAAVTSRGNLPRRIQLRREKGWTKPKDAITVARPTRWGNPYRVVRGVGAEGFGMWSVIGPGAQDVVYAHRREDAIEEAIECFAGWLTPQFIGDAIHLLHGRDLCCWCPLDQPCHADVLLEVANPKGIVTLAPGVECWTERMGGMPTVAGTRIDTAGLAALTEDRGLDADAIAALYPSLTVEQVEQALAFEGVSQRGG